VRLSLILIANEIGRIVVDAAATNGLRTTISNPMIRGPTGALGAGSTDEIGSTAVLGGCR
jgi:hypothetical protein